MMEKQVVGRCSARPTPRPTSRSCSKLYKDGQLDLDGMVTRTYKLGDINQGYQDMRDGKNIRGVLIYDS